MPQFHVWLDTMLLWKVCLSIGVRMPANVWLYKYCIPLLNDQSLLDWRKLCWSNWGAKSNICESLLWSSNNMCTTVTWYCLTSREFMFFINSHSIDNNRMCVLNLYLLNCLFNGFKIRVITKLPNSEQSYKGKVKTHNYINRQNQSTTGKLWKPQWPLLGTGISKEMVGWIIPLFF